MFSYSKTDNLSIFSKRINKLDYLYFGKKLNDSLGRTYVPLFRELASEFLTIYVVHSKIQFLVMNGCWWRCARWRIRAPIQTRRIREPIRRRRLRPSNHRASITWVVPLVVDLNAGNAPEKSKQHFQLSKIMKKVMKEWVDKIGEKWGQNFSSQVQTGFPNFSTNKDPVGELLFFWKCVEDISFSRTNSNWTYKYEK